MQQWSVVGLSHYALFIYTDELCPQEHSAIFKLHKSRVLFLHLQVYMTGSLGRFTFRVLEMSVDAICGYFFIDRS